MVRRGLSWSPRLPRDLVILSLASMVTVFDSGVTAAPVRFSKDVAPILVAKCVACHGPEKTKGGFQLHTFEALMKGGESRAPSVTSGEPRQSKLFELIATPDTDDRMPQKDDPLAPAQIALIEQWIREGASFDGADRKAPLATLLPTVHPPAPTAYERPVPVLALAFSPDGKALAASGYHEVTIWNPNDGTLLRRMANVPRQIHAISFSPDGKWIALAGGTPGRVGEVRIAEPSAPTADRVLCMTTDTMLAMAFAPDRKQLAAGGADNVIRVFDIETGRETLRVEQHADWVMGLAFSPDGSRLASASRDKSARLLDAATGELEQTYLGHGGPVFAVAFSHDGKLVLSGGRDREIHLWQTSDAKKIHELAGFEGDLLRLHVDGEWLFALAADRQARRYAIDGKKSELKRTFAGHQDTTYALAVHAASQRLAAGSYDGEVRVWNTASGELVASFVAAPGLTGRRTGGP